MAQWCGEFSELHRWETLPYRCSYLPTEIAVLRYRVIVALSSRAYDALLARGWRRFGCEFFRPVCLRCSQCRSLRVKVREFTPSRSQRRTLRQNTGIRVTVQPPTVSPDHIRLFNAYHADMHRRRGWPFHPIDEVAYWKGFIGGEWEFAREFLYYENDRLVGVGLADVTSESLSSVYFFHDPAWRPRAPGVFSILQQLAYARQHCVRYHYLGYWVPGSPSMAYKARYRPHELLLRFPTDAEEPEWVEPDGYDLSG
jgi:arginyl-tRNA--protein-N-Asp/Glu arginylyltransferase